MRPKTLLLIVFTLSLCVILTGQNLDEIQILSTLDADTTDELGTSVAISGDFAVVGAWTEDDDVMGNDSLVNAGSAYIYERDSLGVWKEVQKIVASDRSIRDRFGKSVAIDGNHLVVGAHLKDIDSPNPNAGAAYVFERDATGTWNETKILLSSDRAEDDEFGTSVSIFGKTIVIGAPQEDQNEMSMSTKPGAGSVYIYKKDNTGDWTQTQKIVALDRDTADLFGIDVSIWDSTIIIGAYKDDLAVSQEDAGSVYFFQQNISGDFIEHQKVTASDIASEDFFGYAVDIFDDKAVIGAYQEDEDEMNNNTFAEAGSAYIFEKGIDGFWHQEKKLVPSDRQAGDFFGYDVSISGNVVLVGAPLEDQDEAGANFKNSSGSVYAFDRDSLGDWSQLQKISASDRGFFHSFGTSVAISTDYAFVGSPFHDISAIADDNAGMAYVFYASCLQDLIMALDSLPSHLYKSDSTLVTLDSVQIFPTDSTIFQAGTSITLNPGFWAQTGSEFLARLDVCIIPPFQTPIASNEFQKRKIKTIPNSSMKVFPNPNHGSMTLQFSIEDESPTRIDLFHSSGKFIQTIFTGKTKGEYSVDVKEELSAGVYFFRLKNESQQDIYKVVILQN